MRTPPWAARNGPASQCACADRELSLDADHGVVRAGHADVGHRRGAAGQHAGVGGLDVGVRAEHGRHASVEPARECDLLARRLGVDVDDDDRACAPRLLDELVHELPRARAGSRKSEPMRLITATGVPSRRRRDREPAPGRAGAEVRGPDDPLGGREVRRDLGPPPGVVAERDRVRSVREQLLGEARRDADPVRRVLPVDDRRPSTSCCSRSARQVILVRPRPGPDAPTTSPTKRISHRL